MNFDSIDYNVLVPNLFGLQPLKMNFIPLSPVAMCMDYDQTKLGVIFFLTPFSF